MKKTLIDIIDEHEIELPNPWVYGLYKIIVWFSKVWFKPKFTYHFDPKELKDKQVILIGDHASWETPLFVMGGYPFASFNAVNAYQDIFVKFLFRLYLAGGVIVKRQYSTDLRALRQMIKVISMGGNLCFFPEGVNSVTGSNHPINPSTVSMLKELGVTVVLCKTYGSHCLRPFYKKHSTRGFSEYSYEILFTPEELAVSSKEALYQKLLERIRYNDFKWNHKAKHPYKWKTSNAEGVDKVVYLCPKCGEEFTLYVEEDEIICKACGNRIRMNEYYGLEKVGENSVCPYEDIDDWHKAQRSKMREDIKDPNYSLSYDCDLQDLYVDKTRINPYYKSGEGTITIDHQGVHYVGTSHGKNVNLLFDIKSTPSYLYYLDRFNILPYQDKLYFFTPKQDSKKVIKYVLAVEELHNAIDPAWDEVSRDAYGL